MSDLRKVPAADQLAGLLPELGVIAAILAEQRRAIHRPGFGHWMQWQCRPWVGCRCERCEVLRAEGWTDQAAAEPVTVQGVPVRLCDRVIVPAVGWVITEAELEPQAEPEPARAETWRDRAIADPLL